MTDLAMDSPCDLGALAHKKELRIGLISNTNSGHNRDHFPRVNAILDRHPFVHHLPTRHGDDVRPALDELARREIDILAINGGDGTAAKVLGQVLDHAPFPRRPPVVLLPGGTANMTAGVVGGCGNHIDAVQRLCAWATPGRRACAHARHPILRVQLGDHGAVSYGMFLGAGTVIQGTEYAHRTVHPLGLRGDSSLSVVVARTIWGMVRKDPRFAQPVSMGLALDDEAPLPRQEALVLLVSSLEKLFLGIDPFWGGGDGPVRLTLIRKDPERLLRNLPSILRGRPRARVSETAGYLSRNARSATLWLDGTINLDGEIHHVRRADGPVRISQGGEFTFLRV